MLVPFSHIARGTETSARHHRDSVAYAEQLRKVAADKKYSFLAAGYQFIDQLVDLRFARDVDAFGRLVEDEDVDVVMQQAAHRHFLLITAGQFRDGLPRSRASDREAIDPSGRGRILTRRQHRERRPERFEARQRHVVGDAQPAREPLADAILAEHAHPLTPSLVRRRRTGVDADADPTALHRLETKDCPQQPRAAGAEQSGDADHFAATQRQRRGARHDRVELEHRIARRANAARIELVERAPDHQPDDLFGAGRRRDAVARVASVAQHDEPIGHRLHFLDEMGNVDDGDALALQPPDAIEQLSHVRVREAARRLVEHEHAAADRDRPRDLDELLRRRRKIADDRV